ncbi:MAG: GNAT family N-acetyltransferase [Phenylobacterium sp.]|nr:MAG: GNAT family N-acetyltransferase [Phenylobacterium sp.]
MYDYRPVGPDDLDLVCRHRQEMFKASGRSDEMLAPMAAPFRAWLAPKLASGAYFGWIADAEGQPVAGLGMMVIDWPPHPSHMDQDARGYILNVFVEPAHRGRGVAGALMARATEEGRRRGLAYLVLHATAMARPMYDKLGWAQTSEMSISL